MFEGFGPHLGVGERPLHRVRAGPGRPRPWQLRHRVVLTLQQHGMTLFGNRSPVGGHSEGMRALSRSNARLTSDAKLSGEGLQVA